MEPTILPDEKDRFKSYLNLFLPLDISTILLDHDAIIAGGSVLQSVTLDSKSENFLPKDIDIYVHLKNAQSLFNSLTSAISKFRTTTQKCMLTVLKNYPASEYDASFLVKNNILGRFHCLLVLLKNPGLNTTMRDYIVYGHDTLDIDIMVVSDNVSLESVVDNFDLSFCKVWYDGRNILTNHPEDIKTKTGFLGKDYLITYLQGNTFTAKRIKKYIKRGFKVLFPRIDTSSVSMEKQEHKVISPEIWVVYTLLSILLERLGDMCESSFSLIFKILSVHTNVSSTFAHFFKPEEDTHPAQKFSLMILCLQKLEEYKTRYQYPSLYNINGFKSLLTFLYSDRLTQTLPDDVT